MPDPWQITLGVVGACVFSVIEYAYRFYSISKLEKLVNKREAGWQERLYKTLDKDHYFSYASSLLSLVSLALFVHPLSQGRPWWVVLLCIIGLLFFAKSFLRSLVRHNAEVVVLRTLPLMKMLMYLTWPLTVFGVLMEEKLFRKAEDDSEEAQDSIMSMVEDSEIEGTIDKSESEMIRGVFELGDTTVGEVMTPRTNIKALNVDVTLEEARSFILEHGHSRIPAYDEDIDQIVGIFYSKDILSHITEVDNKTVRQLIRPPVLMPESKKVAELLQEFRKRKTHIGIVLDEYGGTSGLVTIEDILEEIVGEIQDEYDKGDHSAPIRRIGPHTFEVDATVNVGDLNRELGLELEEDTDFDTVAGFLIHSMEKIPKPGDSIHHGSANFLVVAATARKIERVRVEVNLEPADDDGERASH